MSKAKPKYEVVDYASQNGFFIHGGNIGETFIKNKEDAEFICNALNTMETLKLKRTKARLDEALYSIEQLVKSINCED